jgi:hypothetical protein
LARIPAWNASLPPARPPGKVPDRTTDLVQVFSAFGAL